MSEHGPFAAAAATDSKTSSSKKWRGKLFSRDKVKLSADEQVDDFLASSRHPQQPQSQPAVTELPPVDLFVSSSSSAAAAAEWYPDARKRSSSSSSPTLPQVDLPHPPNAPPHLATTTASRSYTKKRPRRPGLRVAFSNGAPEIIGEGGDEAEAPTMEVMALQRARSNSSTSGYSGTSGSFTSQSYGQQPRQQQQQKRVQSPPQMTHPASLAVQSPSESAPDPLWKPPLMHNAQDSDFMLSMGAGNNSHSHLSLRGDPEQSSFARRVQAQMRAEEGKALQQNRFADPTQPGPQFDPESESEPDEPPVSSHSNNNSSPSPPYGEPPRSEKGSGPSFWTDVLSALPSKSKAPQNKEYRTYNASPTSAAEPPRNTPPPPYAKTQPSYAPHHERNLTRESSTSDSIREFGDENSRDPSGPKKSLRSMANVVGDSATADFASYVAEYEKIFSVAAESVKPSMESSLSEWIRASVWWFLEGRAALESVMRARPPSRGAAHSISTEQLQQAVVNLAKAWWINQHVVPRHPELRRFGNINTDAMVAVASTAGEHRTSNLLSLHQNLIASLRALAMSMKRNNILPSVASAQSALSCGVDTSIWLKYPFFSADVAAVLSGTASRSMLVESQSKNHDIAEIMPIKDTDRCFFYGRMFVEAFISSGEDDSQQYAIPCMLSITREITDWNVIATITSQSELVNIIVQSDRKQGPTWHDVQWDVRNHALTLRLPRGFELDINFKEADFKMLWKIVEYTRKVDENLAPEEGEKPIYEDILNVFQYFDKSPSPAFPTEPTKRCRIRLFEKTVRITEGTGSRESHRGFRLVAVTSPKVKSLSTVCHTLGNGAPIVFSYLRGDDGAPALMLKLEEKGSTHSMLMTFSDPEQRSKMHSLLMGISPTVDEEKLVSDLPLKSFSMQPPGQNTDNSSLSTPLQFSSASASVINALPDYGDPTTVLSEHLRVFVNCNWGSVTDRINIGMITVSVFLSLIQV